MTLNVINTLTPTQRLTSWIPHLIGGQATNKLEIRNQTGSSLTVSFVEDRKRWVVCENLSPMIAPCSVEIPADRSFPFVIAIEREPMMDPLNDTLMIPVYR